MDDRTASESVAPGPAHLTALQARDRIAEGRLTAVDLVKACLERITAHEEAIGAWQHLDPDRALEQAREADAWRRSGRAIGPLHGVPVGIKDIVDTKDMPTQHGSPAFAGRQPGEDAALVAALRDAGAIVLGKTVTTELASRHPGKTRNPHNGERTPGGSSSGSAAAVAAHMAPLAIGTQTAGSVIRPAAYCGIYGFKPTFGLVSRHGVLTQSPFLDTVGVFARTVEDLALCADCLTASDARDADMWPRSRPRLLAATMQDPPAPPRLAFVKGPAWSMAEPATVEAFAELVEHLGEGCEEIRLPADFDEALLRQRMVQRADIARHFGPMADREPDAFSDVLKALVEEGRKVSAIDYNIARDYRTILNAGLERLFHLYSAIVTPAASGPAPMGLESTGDPSFCAVWTYLGAPAICLPLLEADALPMGVQLVGQPRNDGRLLRTARWLAATLASDDDR